MKSFNCLPINKNAGERPLSLSGQDEVLQLPPHQQECWREALVPVRGVAVLQQGPGDTIVVELACWRHVLPQKSLDA